METLQFSCGQGGQAVMQSGSEPRLLSWAEHQAVELQQADTCGGGTPPRGERGEGEEGHTDGEEEAAWQGGEGRAVRRPGSPGVQRRVAGQGERGTGRREEGGPIAGVLLHEGEGLGFFFFSFLGFWGQLQCFLLRRRAVPLSGEPLGDAGLDKLPLRPPRLAAPVAASPAPPSPAPGIHCLGPQNPIEGAPHHKGPLASRCGPRPLT